MDSGPQLFELQLDDDGETGVKYVSIVDDPAIGENFVALKNQRTRPVVLENNGADQQLAVGPLIIPGQQIFRSDAEIGEYFVRFNAETIRKVRDKFFAENNGGNINLNHGKRVANARVVEAWIIEDSQKDKAAALGYDLPKGTLMVGVKVDDKAAWAAIKNKEYVGFSLEGFFNYERVVQEIKNQRHESTGEVEEADKELIRNFFSHMSNILSKLGLKVGGLNRKADKMARQKVRHKSVQMMAGVHRISRPEVLGEEYGDPVTLVITPEGIAGVLNPSTGQVDALPDGAYLMDDGSELVVVDGMVARPEGEEMGDKEEKREEMQRQRMNEDAAPTPDYRLDSGYDIFRDGPDGALYFLDPAGNRAELPNGTYDLADGRQLEVVEGHMYNIIDPNAAPDEPAAAPPQPQPAAGQPAPREVAPNGDLVPTPDAVGEPAAIAASRQPQDRQLFALDKKVERLAAVVSDLAEVTEKVLNTPAGAQFFHTAAEPNKSVAPSMSEYLGLKTEAKTPRQKNLERLRQEREAKKAQNRKQRVGA